MAWTQYGRADANTTSLVSIYATNVTYDTLIRQPRTYSKTSVSLSSILMINLVALMSMPK